MAESDPKFLSVPGDVDRPGRPRAKRDSLFLLTTISGGDGVARGQVRVRNLSATGLMADCEHMFRKDDPVTIELRGVGAVAGHVAWANGRRIGVAFDHPIDPQLARKPVHAAPADGMAPYLRQLNAKARFSR